MTHLIEQIVSIFYASFQFATSRKSGDASFSATFCLGVSVSSLYTRFSATFCLGVTALSLDTRLSYRRSTSTFHYFWQHTFFNWGYQHFVGRRHLYMYIAKKIYICANIHFHFLFILFYLRPALFISDTLILSSPCARLS